MRRPKAKATSRKGINHVRSVVEECNCSFQEITQDNDLGNDAYIEFIHDEEASSFCVAVQVKSGKSFLRKNYAVIPSDKRHFEYWRNHILPIAGIVHDPEKGVSYWTNITRFLRENPTIVDSGPYRILLPYSHTFEASKFDEFVQDFMLFNLKGTLEENFGISLRYLANVENENDVVEAVKSLFFFHRDKDATWFYLNPYISRTRNIDVRRLIISYLSIAVGNPDHLYGPNLRYDQEIAKYCTKQITQLANVAFICDLLESVDEEEFRRGSIGQCVHILLEPVQGIIDKLLTILLETTRLDGIRYGALCLHVLLSKAHDENVEWEIELAKRFIRSSREPQFRTLATELVQTLREYGSIGY